MTRITRTRLSVLCIFVVQAFQAAWADDYLEARSRLVDAYQAEEFDLMIVAAHDALRARPAYPGALFNLALAETLAGDTAKALSTLERLTKLDVDLGIDNNEAFAPLHTLENWPDLVARVERLRKPVGSAEAVWSSGDGHFIPEGIAVVGHSVYIGSIRKGRIDHINESNVRTVMEPVPGETGSVFGMRLDDDSLWFATAATTQFAGKDPTAGSRLCRLDLEESAPVCVALPPREDAKQTLGDLIIDDRFIYTTDQTDGQVYRYDRTENQWHTLVDKGAFTSPQGLVKDADGEHLYVADYRGGIYRVRLDGSVPPERVTSEACLYGVDGLYRYGSWLITVQNGITPHRVSAHRLSADGVTVTDSRILLMNHAEFDEPTLGHVVHDDFYVVANSHWNRFDVDNRLPDELAGPVILRVQLPTK